MHLRYDHPKTQVVPNDQLQVVVTRDVIMHSCCMPPNLVVSGKITNTSDKPIDYVRLHFAFEDKNGKIPTYTYHDMSTRTYPVYYLSKTSEVVCPDCVNEHMILVEQALERPQIHNRVGRL